MDSEVTLVMTGENKRKADEEGLDADGPDTKHAKQEGDDDSGLAQLSAEAQAVIDEKVATGSVRPVASTASPVRYDNIVHAAMHRDATYACSCHQLSTIASNGTLKSA